MKCAQGKACLQIAVDEAGLGDLVTIAGTKAGLPTDNSSTTTLINLLTVTGSKWDENRAQVNPSPAKLREMKNRILVTNAGPTAASPPDLSFRASKRAILASTERAVG